MGFECIPNLFTSPRRGEVDLRGKSVEGSGAVFITF
jgi:hypothetical protein